MSRPVISVHNLGKEYVIGARANRDATFREMVSSAAAAPFRRLKRLRGNVEPEEHIWALKDVSFDVAEGDVLGIIGRNGAGKSTLLKVLSRITPPTTGRVEIRGRVASLLEVGTGFHPELTGRENIYLNGAILGMSRAEITRKFDEIVDFAGVERFIDTPVKRYSSGMYLRLAFSVAAHLEPEILIVDEVLAVGDAEFQKKCLGKMKEVAGQGRTVLFVSHNIGAIRSLSTNGIYLKGGVSQSYPSIGAAVEAYLGEQHLTSVWEQVQGRAYEGFAPHRLIQTSSNVITLTGQVTDTSPTFVIALRITNGVGDEIFWTTHRDSAEHTELKPGQCALHISIPDALGPGDYTAELVTFRHNERYIITTEDGIKIRFRLPRRPEASSWFEGGKQTIIRPIIRWRHTAEDAVA